MSIILTTFIIVPMVSALVVFLAAKLKTWLADLLANLTTLYLLAISIGLYFWRPFNHLLVYRTLVLDGLSQLLLLAIALAAFLITIYSVAYMERYTAKGKYYALLLLMLAGMNGVVLTGNLFHLYVFLEIAALASAALVAFGTEAEETEAALKYFVISTLASLLIIFGIALIYALAGTVRMAEIARFFPAEASQIKLLITALFITGFAAKAALFPFHAWLPDAHPAAPAPISAMLSGVLIKSLGIYALARIFYNVLGLSPAIAYILMWLGILSIFVGALLAIFQNDFKRLLACSSISQVGYIALGLGLASPLGLMGALFHLFNHAIFKPLMFLNAGAVEYATGTRKMSELGGLGQKMPLSSKTNLIGALSVSGLPPFNGFWSKLFIIVACVQVGQVWLGLLAAAASFITLAYFLKAQKQVFGGELPARFNQIKEAPWPMGFSVIILALLCLAIGLMYPFFLFYLINPAVVALANGLGYGVMLVGGLK